MLGSTNLDSLKLMGAVVVSVISVGLLVIVGNVKLDGVKVVKVVKRVVLVVIVVVVVVDDDVVLELDIVRVVV